MYTCIFIFIDVTFIPYGGMSENETEFASTVNSIFYRQQEVLRAPVVAYRQNVFKIFVSSYAKKKNE